MSGAVRRPLPLRAALLIGAGLLAALAVGPALWLLLVALQPSGRDMASLSVDLTLNNFEGAWKRGDPEADWLSRESLFGPLLNSVVVTLGRAALNVLLAALAAYPLARMNFRGRDALGVAILATMMIPEQVTVVPMFRTVVEMGMADTLLALVIPLSVSAFGVHMCRTAFAQIPVEMEEAARIDGAGPLAVWWHVMLPLAAPALATLGLFSVIAAWSDLLWPIMVLQSRERYTLPVAVNELLGVFSTNQRLAYAGSVLALAPIIAAFVLSQRWFRPQMFAGAVKG